MSSNQSYFACCLCVLLVTASSTNASGTLTGTVEIHRKQVHATDRKTPLETAPQRNKGVQNPVFGNADNWFQPARGGGDARYGFDLIHINTAMPDIGYVETAQTTKK